MGRYIIRRLLWVIVLLLVVSALTFVVFIVLPAADPARIRAGRQPTEQLVRTIRHNLYLDRPLYAQYFHFVKQMVLHADFGKSFTTNDNVRQEIFSRLPVTASLSLGALVIWMLGGVGVGIISAVRRRSVLDRVAMGAALLAISAPIYWLGLVTLYLFSNDIGLIHIFPGSGSYTPFTQNPVKWFTSLLLPWMVLATAFAAIYARLLRGNLIETLGEDYVRTARAKGLPEGGVIRHAVRSAITPIVTIVGIDLGLLLAGNAILTETVFNIPGIGRYAYTNGIVALDLPVIQGTVVMGTLFIVVLNLLVDIGYAFLDPRVRYS